MHQPLCPEEHAGLRPPLATPGEEERHRPRPERVQGLWQGPGGLHRAGSADGGRPVQPHGVPQALPLQVK